MKDVLIITLQFFMSLSLLVLVHEFGHFIAARIFKVRVEKFYLFFNPWFSIFKFKPKNSDTEYGIGWLPLGGYVKIAGMIDESMDKEQMAQPAKPDEFRAKPAWQRLIIMVAGVVMNFLLAIFIYSMMLFAWGDTYLPTQNAKMGMEFGKYGKEIGFQDGDILISADDVPFERYDGDALRMIADASLVQVKRNGENVSLPVPSDFMLKLIEHNEGFANYRVPMVVGKVLDKTPADEAGLLAGDSIYAINDTVIVPSFSDFRNLMADHKSKSLTVNFYREGQANSLVVKPDSAGLIGIAPISFLQIFPTVTHEYGFLASFPAGVKSGVKTLKGYVGDMKYVFTKQGAQSVGSFFSIGSLFPPFFDARAFWTVTALLSVILAFMNILPIPALDGGHVLFLLYEVITRRKPSDKFLENAQMVGMFLLLALMVLALGNDIRKFFF